MKSNHFSLQPEINYNFVKHDIVYLSWIGGPSSTGYNANYKVSCSSLQLSFSPKFTLGTDNKFNLLLGIYTNIPFYIEHKGQLKIQTSNYYTQSGSITVKTNNEIRHDIVGDLGVLLGIGVKLPTKRNFISIHMRVGRSLSDIMSSPNIKETVATLRLTYR